VKELFLYKLVPVSNSTNLNLWKTLPGNNNNSSNKEIKFLSSLLLWCQKFVPIKEGSSFVQILEESSGMPGMLSGTYGVSNRLLHGQRGVMW